MGCHKFLTCRHPPLQQAATSLLVNSPVMNILRHSRSPTQPPTGESEFYYEIQ
jgi:hypothetical protein